MQNTSKVPSCFKDRENALLLLVALFVPRFVGFQYLEWLYNGSTHFTVSTSSLIWALTFSDWFFGVDGNLLGWLLLPSTATVVLFLLPFLLFSSNVSSLAIVSFVAPIVDLLFVGTVIAYKEKRIRGGFVIISGIIMIVSSIVAAIVYMTVNVIYGIPPGLYMFILEPDVDTRFFTPIPILLIVGLYQARKASRLEITTKNDNSG